MSGPQSISQQQQLTLTAVTKNDQAKTIFFALSLITLIGSLAVHYRFGGDFFADPVRTGLLASSGLCLVICGCLPKAKDDGVTPFNPETDIRFGSDTIPDTVPGIEIPPSYNPELIDSNPLVDNKRQELLEMASTAPSLLILIEQIKPYTTTKTPEGRYLRAAIFVQFAMATCFRDSVQATIALEQTWREMFSGQFEAEGGDSQKIKHRTVQSIQIEYCASIIKIIQNNRSQCNQDSFNEQMVEQLRNSAETHANEQLQL